MYIEQIARDYAEREFAKYMGDQRTPHRLSIDAFKAGYAHAREAEITAARHDREEIGKLHSQIDKLKAEVDLKNPLPSGAGGIRAEWDKSAGKYTFSSFGDHEAVKAIQAVIFRPFPPNPTDVYTSKPTNDGMGVSQTEIMAKVMDVSDQVAGEGVMADNRHAVLADMLLALQNRIESIERVHAKDILNREKEYPNIMAMLDGINRAVVELTWDQDAPDVITEEKQDESGLKAVCVDHAGNVWEFSPDRPPRFYPAFMVDKEGNWRT